MSKKEMPDCLRKFFTQLYPDLDLNLVDFYEGIPWPFSIGKQGAITLGSWTSRKINIHFAGGRWNPFECGGIKLIGHELYHAQDIFSMWSGFGWGLFRPWYLAYLYCGIWSGFSFREKHMLERPAYEYERKIDAGCHELSSNTGEGPCIDDKPDTETNEQFISDFIDKYPDLIIRRKNSSLIETIIQSTAEGIRNLLNLTRKIT